jgi:hypothetical protein
LGYWWRPSQEPFWIDSALVKHAEHKQSENCAQSEATVSGLSVTPSHQQLPMDAPQGNLVPQAAHTFVSGSPAIDSPAIDLRFGKPALMLIVLWWERA